VAIRARANEDVKRRIDARSMWPLAVVVDHDMGVGLIMRELSNEFFTPFTYSIGDVDRIVREVQLEDTSLVRASTSAQNQLLKHLGPSRTSVLMKTLDPTPQNRPRMATVAQAIAIRG
jgi:hypothetical protein